MPRQLAGKWLKDYPYRQQLLRSDEQFVDFAAYLQQQPSVAAVDAIRFAWQGEPHDRKRCLEVSVQLREPMFALGLANGQNAWIDAEGIVFAISAGGPKHGPLVRGLEFGGQSAFKELAQIWPQLESQIPTITHIDLAAPLGTAQDMGIVFTAEVGTRFIWGRPGEDQFGVGLKKKVDYLVHAINCQGDLRRVPEINVRFAPEVFARLPEN